MAAMKADKRESSMVERMAVWRVGSTAGKKDRSMVEKMAAWRVV